MLRLIVLLIHLNSELIDEAFTLVSATSSVYLRHKTFLYYYSNHFTYLASPFTVNWQGHFSTDRRPFCLICFRTWLESSFASVNHFTTAQTLFHDLQIRAHKHAVYASTYSSCWFGSLISLSIVHITQKSPYPSIWLTHSHNLQSLFFSTFLASFTFSVLNPE